VTASGIFPILCAVLVISIVVTAVAISACGDGDDDEESGGDALPIVATFFGADDGDSAAALAPGDFNGDGETDVALGAAFADGPDEDRADAGEVYVFLGPFAEGDELDAAEGDQLLTIFGAAAGDNLGRALVAADFDEDGVDELGIGAPGVSNLRGSVYVIFNVATRPEGRELDLAQSPLGVMEMRGQDEGDYTGLALAAGDLDEFPGPDLLVGALLADGPDNTRTDAGAVYVVSGPRSGASASISLAEVTTVIHGASAGDRLGETVGTGDVTGDGKDDALLAAPFADGPNDERTDAGETYIVPAFRDDLDLAVNVPITTIMGIDAGDQLGHSLTVTTGNGGPPGVWLGAVSADGPDNAVDLAGEGVYVVGTDSA
jgi:FG-GAP repeat